MASSRALAVQHGRHHPCWKAAHFLPCTRPPDVALLKRRSYFMSQLGQRYVWMLKFSMIEWPTLSAQEKKLHTAIRRSFVTSYVFGPEAILQYWLWKTLKNATQSFGPSSCNTSKCSPPTMTLPPLEVLMLGNPFSLCSRVQVLLSLISLL